MRRRRKRRRGINCELDIGRKEEGKGGMGTFSTQEERERAL